MIQIKENIFFDSAKPLEKQSIEFQQWIDDARILLVNAVEFDEYERPELLTKEFENYLIKSYPVYSRNSKSDWSKRSTEIEIKKL